MLIDPLWQIEMGPSGPKGDKGDPSNVPGPTGPRGADGVGYRWRGEYSPRATYAPNDTVEFEGSTFVCTKESKGRSPDSSKNFELMAKRGAKGKPGEAGGAGQRGRSSLPMQMDMLARIEQLEANGGGIASVRMSAIFDSNTSAGDVVYVSGDGHVDLAQANNGDTATAVGIATGDVLAGQTGEYIPVGPITIDTWALTPGTVYYLSPNTPGGLTDIYPDNAGEFVVILGTAATPIQMNLKIHWMVEQS